jgi:hypothetical protein
VLKVDGHSIGWSQRVGIGGPRDFQESLPLRRCSLF